MDKFYNSVRLDKDLCTGCTNCIKRCPTQAIRVRNGKAVIKKEHCIDCGECIRRCTHHAKKATYDSIDIMKEYEYTVALPAPSLYAQFNNLDDVNIVLTALKKMGFDDVYEVSAAAEIVSKLSREYVKNNKDKWPIISTACPSVIRLIRVRFPSLIPNLLPINTPMDLAAKIARQNAMAKTGLPSEKIGIIFISPCPAKVTAVRMPLALDKSEVDAVVAMSDIYPILLDYMKQSVEKVEDITISGKIGIGWGETGGEASGILTDRYLAADGIENVISVLEQLEEHTISGLQFIELDACAGGCVGGVLTVENPFIAKVKIESLRKYMPVARNHFDIEELEGVYWNKEIEYEPVFNLGSNITESIKMLNKVNELEKSFPGLDCGSCGAPSCRALAEDIVKGNASKEDCIHILRQCIFEKDSIKKKI